MRRFKTVRGSKAEAKRELAVTVEMVCGEVVSRGFGFVGLALFRRGDAPVDGNVNVRVGPPLTADEQEQLDAWIRTCGNDLIDKVTIECAVVTLYGSGLGQVMSAMAIRYPGHLIGVLDEAFATLYNTP